MAKHSITAVFDTRSQAEQAMAQLTSAGIPASDLTLLPAAGETVSSIEAGKGFWGSLEQLFGGTDDHATYAESIRRGGIMLSVRAEDDRLDHVIDILEQHGSVDLDERESTWRSEGWTGGSPVSGTATTGSSSAMAGSRGLGLDDPGMTAMGGASESRMGNATPGLGAIGAGALGVGAGALGTMAYEERREVAPPVQPVAERSTLVADRAVTDRATVPAAAAAGDETIKVYEERLDIGKRSVSRGKVRVHTSVVSRDVSESVTLHGETVSVDRHVVDRPVSAATLDIDPFQERTIEMEEFAEEAVVAKSAFVVEEIGIRKEAVDHVETVHETLRKTVVDIEDGRTAGATAVGSFASRLVKDMDVVGSDGQHVGIIDHVDGTMMKLKRLDPASGGQHHLLPADLVASVSADGKALLGIAAAEAMRRWKAA